VECPRNTFSPRSGGGHTGPPDPGNSNPAVGGRGAAEKARSIGWSIKNIHITFPKNTEEVYRALTPATLEAAP
jgi:hypothetical protein